MDIQSAPNLPKELVSKIHNGDGISVLFDLQKELMVEYVRVESLPQWPINPHEPKSQVILKDFIGRIAEELGEGWEYYEKLMSLGTRSLANLAGFNEEIADTTAFLLETLIYVGVTPRELEIAMAGDETNLDPMSTMYYGGFAKPVSTCKLFNLAGEYPNHIDYLSAGDILGEVDSEYTALLIESHWQFNYKLQMAKNVLKNKPWKQHQVMTDENKFKSRLIEAATIYFKLCLGTLQMTPLGFIQVYYKKNRINLFRVKSKY